MPRIHNEPHGIVRAKALNSLHGSVAPGIGSPRRLSGAPVELFRRDVIDESEAMQRLRILVVEYDLTVGPLVAEMLEDIGHDVCAIEVDVDNAVVAAARYHPDLMIVDLGLGQGPCSSAIKKIFRDGVVPCVFLIDDVLPDPSRAPGAVIVRKPFRAPEIIAAILRATGGAGRRGIDALY